MLHSFKLRTASVTGLCALFTVGLLVTLVGGAAAAPTAVSLGTAQDFAVLAGAGITNTGPTTVNGNIGTYPTTTVTGSGSMTVNGTNHAGDANTQAAKTDLVTAYNAAAGEGPTSPIVADLGGRILTSGVYNSASSIGLTGVLTLDGGGNPDSVFVFQAGSALTTASGSLVALVNGAQACNVFWQIGSSATLGVGSNFKGSILALTSITVTTGVTVDGRVLARNGAVTLDSDTISRTGCSVPPDTTAAATTAPVTTTAPATTAAVATAAVTTVRTATTRATTVRTVTRQAAAPKVPAATKQVVVKKKVLAKAKTSSTAVHAQPAVRSAAFTG